MNNPQGDYLWNPSDAYDEDVGAIEMRLRPLSAESLQLTDRPLRIPVRHSNVMWRVAAAFAGALLLGMGALEFRLSWTASAPWPVAIQAQGGGVRNSVLRVDERLTTQSGESLKLNAARIGTVTVAPESTVRLIESRRGHHRLELDHGRLHAKIWAPANYFSVRSGESRFVDLGCEFDLEMNASGDGSLTVESGFVIHRAADRELLVPAGYRVTLREHQPSIAIRPNAPEEFRSAVSVLHRMLTNPDLSQDAMFSAKGRGLTDEIAKLAVDADYFTLLDLLVRHPALAKTELYPRLAAILNVAADDEQHRLRWIQGDVAAREQWWDKLPRQPKSWWLNWRDAF